MQLGFVSAIFPDLSLEEVLACAAAEGFGCVEVMCWPPGKADRRYAGVAHLDVTSLNDQTWFDRAGNFHSDALHVVERYTPRSADTMMYEATIEDPRVFTKPWKISLPLYRRLEPNAQILEFRCMEMVEETTLGQLRKAPLVTHWEGKTMIIDVKRKVPPLDQLYEKFLSGNPPEPDRRR